MQHLDLDLFRSVVAEHVGMAPTAVSADARLVEDLGLHSIDLADIIARVEQICGRELLDLELDGARTVAQAHHAIHVALADPA